MKIHLFQNEMNELQAQKSHLVLDLKSQKVSCRLNHQAIPVVDNIPTKFINWIEELPQNQLQSDLLCNFEYQIEDI